MKKTDLDYLVAQLKGFTEHNSSSPETLRRFDSFDKRLTDIKEEIMDGIKGMHARQDKTNGNVQRNGKWIEENKEFISDLKEDFKFLRHKMIGKVLDYAFKGAVFVGILYILIEKK